MTSKPQPWQCSWDHGELGFETGGHEGWGLGLRAGKGGCNCQLGAWNWNFFETAASTGIFTWHCAWHAKQTALPWQEKLQSGIEFQTCGLGFWKGGWYRGQEFGIWAVIFYWGMRFRTETEIRTWRLAMRISTWKWLMILELWKRCSWYWGPWF